MSDDDRWSSRERQFSEHPVRSSIKGLSLGWIIAMVGIVLIGVTSILLWAFGVFTSDIKGQGEAEKIKNEAANRIWAQEGFEDLFQKIKAADKVIIISANALEVNPNDGKLRTEMIGQKQYCTDLVGQYNAKARQFRSEDFRAADLPAQIDEMDSHTDCKEAAG